MSRNILQKFRLKNFKAIRDSKTVTFGPLTVLIGNNGSGKSSLVEGLEMVCNISKRGLDEPMNEWRGFENIWHQGVEHKLRRVGSTPYRENSMEFALRLNIQRQTITTSTKVSVGLEDRLLFVSEKIIKSHTERTSGRKRVKHSEITSRSISGKIKIQQSISGQPETPEKLLPQVDPDISILQSENLFDDWQFVSLAPRSMGSPIPQRRTGGKVRLSKDGSNVAEYLLEILTLDPDAFNGILETLQYVLPYASDIQPTIASELQRSVYLQLTEENYKIPGWLLSSGTMRVLALLALLRHPDPPSLIVVEEIENGLDPRTVHLLIDEIRYAVEGGYTQVIATTHSPYLLDLLSLSHIVLVERVDGEPTFSRPADNKSLENWIQKFGPGRLYTMGKLGSEESR